MGVDLDRLGAGKAQKFLQHPYVSVEAGELLHHAYFPHSIIILLMAVMEDRRPAEMSMFARAGVISPTAATVTNQAVRRCVVQVTGTASQINLDTMRNFIEALMVRILQNMACKAIHSAEARCSRLPIHVSPGPRVWLSSAQASEL